METVTIEKQDHYGKGIARKDNRVIFVDQGLPGETCKIDLMEEKKNFATARVTEILTSSIDRREPFCPYYSSCGGCDLEHESLSAQLDFKKKKVEELLKKFASIEYDITEILSGSETSYRNKVTLHGEGQKVGYYLEGTHELLEIDHCPLLEPKLNQILEILQNYLKTSKNTHLESAMIRTSSTGETMFVLAGKFDYEELKRTFKNAVTTLIVKNQVLLGNGTIQEKIHGLDFQISPTSFFQVNSKMRDAMYQKVMDLASALHPDKILDLYCGTGTMTLLLSPYTKEVVGIELEPSAVFDANENQKKNKVENVTFFCDKVENKIDQIGPCDLIVVDPPRAGLDTKTKEEILRIEPAYIIYVSCDPSTLARDLTTLTKKYELKEITLVDMFPNTHHVECICVLNRR